MTALTTFFKRALVLACALCLAAPVAASARVTFNGDFETGSLSQWSLQQFCPDAATVYSRDTRPDLPEPAEGSYALQLSVADSHVLTGGVNCSATSGTPRGQIATSQAGAEALGPGDDKWESWFVQVPEDFPLVTDPNWFVMQQDFGFPFGGSPPVAFHIKDDGSGANEFRMEVCHDYCGATSTAWSGMQIEPGHWYSFLVHKVFANDDTVGRIELWVDGVRQRFVDGSQTYYTRTLHANCNCTANDEYRFYLNNYHSDALTTGTTTLYFDGARIRDYSRWWR